MSRNLAINVVYYGRKSTLGDVGNKVYTWDVHNTATVSDLKRILKVAVVEERRKSILQLKKTQRNVLKESEDLSTLDDYLGVPLPVKESGDESGDEWFSSPLSHEVTLFPWVESKDIDSMRIIFGGKCLADVDRMEVERVQDEDCLFVVLNDDIGRTEFQQLVEYSKWLSKDKRGKCPTGARYFRFCNTVRKRKDWIDSQSMTNEGTFVDFLPLRLDFPNLKKIEREYAELVVSQINKIRKLRFKRAHPPKERTKIGFPIKEMGERIFERIFRHPPHPQKWRLLSDDDGEIPLEKPHVGYSTATPRGCNEPGCCHYSYAKVYDDCVEVYDGEIEYRFRYDLYNCKRELTQTLLNDDDQL